MKVREFLTTEDAGDTGDLIRQRMPTTYQIVCL